MKRYYSLKHAKETKEKLAKCGEHDDGKILLSMNGTPLLIKENSGSVLNTYISHSNWSVTIQPEDHFSDTYRELPPGTTVVFTQDSLS